MYNFLIIFGTLTLFLGLPVLLILTIVLSVKAKKLHLVCISLPIAFVIGLVMMISGGYLYGESDEYQQALVEEQNEQKEEQLKEELEEPKQEVVKEETDKKKEEKKEEKKEKKPKKNKNQFKYDDVIVTYKEYKITSSGEIIVYFEMENNSTKTRSFDYTFDVYGWQNGIEMDKDFFYDCDEEENANKEIKNGAKIVVAEVFELNNATDNVTIEIRPFFSFIDETLYEIEIELK